MRRIPRPQRSIDVSIPAPVLSTSQRLSSPCRAALATSTPLLRSTSAPFSSSARSALLHADRDKKKHQAFVRRWQKRLLGDSEPIGAHVDPYDPTSPVRIAPEDTGEEIEVLEEAFSLSAPDAQGEIYNYRSYEPSQTGDGLTSVGGKEFVRELKEKEMIARYEKLLSREYPVANYAFGPDQKVAEPEEIRSLFHQAVVETYTLWHEHGDQSGRSFKDVSAYPKRGQYESVPFSFSDVKLTRPGSRISLEYPYAAAKSELLKAITETPAMEQNAESEEAAFASEGLTDAAADAGTTITAPGPPLMKREEGNTFDFMSNRPVPRMKPVSTAGSASTQAAPAATASPAVKVDFEAAAEDSRRIVSEMRHIVLEADVQRATDAVNALREQVHGGFTPKASESAAVVKPTTSITYRHIPLEPEVKFALYKRLVQLTGVRVSDPLLNSSHTLGDLYGNFVNASKPKITKLFDHKLTEYKNGRRIKPDFEPAKKSFERVRGDKQGTKVLETLQALPNVQFYSKKVDRTFKDMKLGRGKIIDYALAERGLPLPMRRVKEVSEA